MIQIIGDSKIVFTDLDSTARTRIPALHHANSRYPYSTVLKLSPAFYFISGLRLCSARTEVRTARRWTIGITTNFGCRAKTLPVFIFAETDFLRTPVKYLDPIGRLPFIFGTANDQTHFLLFNATSPHQAHRGRPIYSSPQSFPGTEFLGSEGHVQVDPGSPEGAHDAVRNSRSTRQNRITEHL